MVSLLKGLPGKVRSSVSSAAKHAWAEPKHSFLCKPGNLTTINCELQRGQGLSCPCVRDMSLLVSYDTFHQFHKTAVFSAASCSFSAGFFQGVLWAELCSLHIKQPPQSDPSALRQDNGSATCITQIPAFTELSSACLEN